MRYALQYQNNCGGREDAPIYGTINHSLFETEVLDFPFSKAGMENQTRYFFAARLKYSRYMYVSFHRDMREETLLRCLIACFQELDGVPWAVVTDNMKTAVLGRTAQHEPIWNPAYQKLAV